MNVARILYPIEVLGPGKRLGIWLVGCHRQCPECSNPELWEEKSYYEVNLQDFIKMIVPILSQRHVDGIIITGGEPFNQVEELVVLLKVLEKYTDDIMVYTGYTLDELKEANTSTIECLNHIGVLIDGPYINKLNNGAVMRGSANQKIHILKKSLKTKYKVYLSSYKNSIQNFMTQDGLVSVGIHKRNFKEDLIEKSRKKGVIFND